MLRDRPGPARATVMRGKKTIRQVRLPMRVTPQLCGKRRDRLQIEAAPAGLSFKIRVQVDFTRLRGSNQEFFSPWTGVRGPKVSARLTPRRGSRRRAKPAKNPPAASPSDPPTPPIKTSTAQLKQVFGSATAHNIEFPNPNTDSTSTNFGLCRPSERRG